MRPVVPLLCIGLALAAAPPIPRTAAAAPIPHHGSARDLRALATRVARGPVVDGALDDPVWAEAAVLDSFTYWSPVEGVLDTLGTQCLVLYDERNLYIGFRCGDDPRLVRAPLVTRDNPDDDFVGVDLDTYDDQRRSMLFGCDPNGVQMDGVFQEGLGDPDFNPDFLYASKARRTATGYEVEMAIPFKSLRFPARDSLTFGFNAWRNVGRNGVLMFWAPLTRDISNLHLQYGRITGLAGIRPGRSLRINPTWTGSRPAERDDQGRLTYDTDSRAGLGIQSAIGSNLTGDLAVTPDFSQIEADAGVVDINRRFAIFYPEKRPFFLENSEIFASPLQLVYTRRIADPLYGLKLTGKAGRTTIGVIHAADRSAGDSLETLPRALDRYLDHDALYDIVRLRHDVASGSQLGLLMGNREHRETYNRGLGADGRLQLSERSVFTFQHVRSWSRERDLRAAVAAMDSAQLDQLDDGLRDATGRILAGNASRAELERTSKRLDATATFADLSRHFAADMGFIERTNQIHAALEVEPHVYGAEHAWFTKLSPGASFARTWEHGDDRWAGRLTDEVAKLSVDADLPLKGWANVWGTRTFTYFDGRAFPDQRRAGVEAGSRRFQAVMAGFEASDGDGIVFDETVPARERIVASWLTLRFSHRFDAGLNFDASIVDRRETDTRFADVAISRLRVSYLLNRELSVRWITEYRSERKYDPSGIPQEGKRALSLDLLGSYVLRPGTVVYLGYGARLEGAEARGMISHARNAFVKLSYLWQV